MEINAIIGLLLGFGIGIFCRWFRIPLPAPPSPMGAVLVIVLTLGYLAGEYLFKTY